MQFALFRVHGIYHLRWKFPDEKPVQRTTKLRSKPQALPRAAQIYAEAEATWKGRRPMITLAELVRDWLQAHPRKSPTHRRNVAAFARQIPALGALPLNRLTTAAVETELATFQAGRSETSCVLWLRILSLLMRWAIRRKILDLLPYQVTAPPVQRQPRVILPPHLTQAWLAAVETQGGPRARLACLLMLMLGLRLEEALRARWEFFRAWDRTYTPSVKRSESARGRTKGKEADPLKVPSALLAILDPRARPEGWILAGPRGGTPDPQAIRDAMQAANKACGTPGITPHRLRSTLATRLAAKAPIQEAQKRLRHKDARTTMGYLQADQAAVEKAQEEVFSEMGFE
jgi:integrase